MTTREAVAIIERNYRCLEKSLIYDLHERSKFSKKRFWEYYDSVICLARAAENGGRDMDTAMKITWIYQRILKEFIYHFDRNDLSALKKFPKDYNGYIERLDGAMDAYFRGVFTDDRLFDLQRQTGGTNEF